MNDAIGSLASRWPAVLGWSALLVFETVCQIALKYAGEHTGPFDFSPPAFATAAASPWLWVAVACYVGAFVAWMTILRRSKLSKAFPTTAIVFVAVLIAARVLLGDVLGWHKLLGSVIIVAGILMLGPDSPGSDSDT